MSERRQFFMPNFANFFSYNTRRDDCYRTTKRQCMFDQSVVSSGNTIRSFDTTSNRKLSSAETWILYLPPQNVRLICKVLCHSVESA